MSCRIHTTRVYDIRYGSTFHTKFNEIFIDLIRQSNTGYVSEDESDLEIDKDELLEIRPKCQKDVQEVIDTILKESDPNNNYIHLSIF